MAITLKAMVDGHIRRFAENMGAGAYTKYFAYFASIETPSCITKQIDACFAKPAVGRRTETGDSAEIFPPRIAIYFFLGFGNNLLVLAVYYCS